MSLRDPGASARFGAGVNNGQTRRRRLAFLVRTSCSTDPTRGDPRLFDLPSDASQQGGRELKQKT